MVSLSLGFYHETPGAVEDEAGLFKAIRALQHEGVCIVAAAGNGATTLPFWPAALAAGDTPDTGHGRVPVVSVGARNPNDGTIAAFSNTGEWVRTYRCGVAVVSTMPVTFEGSLRGGFDVAARQGRPARGTPDPDDYSSGFGIWNGSSFAAPACAGDVAHLMCDQSFVVDSRPHAEEDDRARRAGRRGQVMRQTGAESLAVRAADAFRAYRDGEPAAMSTLVDEVTPLLWAVARQQGLHHQAAEDVVQNTWLKLVEHAPSIADPQSVLKWLITTTKRDAWSSVSRGHRDEPAPHADVRDVEPDATAPSPELAVLAEADDRLLWNHFATLSDRCKALLRAIAFAEKPDYATVAQALGMPVGSIGPTRGRCLAKLRHALATDPRWEMPS